MAKSSQEILHNIIVEKVYNETISEYNEVADRDVKWVMDFKGQVVNKVFLENYAIEFFETIKKAGYTRIQIGGLESTAIPIVGALVLLDTENIICNSFYIRKSKKKSSLPNLIEGEILKDIPIILVDDIINSGSSFKKSQTILQEKYCMEISGVFTALRFRDMPYYVNFHEKSIQVWSIFELHDFGETLGLKNIQEKDKNIIQEDKYTIYKTNILCKANPYIVVPKSAPLLNGKNIYIGIDDGNFLCIDKETSTIVWSFKVLFGSDGKRILSSAAIYKDYVFFGAYDGIFYCLDKHTGKIKWTYIDADWIGSSPCINHQQGIVYIGLEFGLWRKKGGIVALNIKTGKFIWKNYDTMGECTHASPAYNHKHSIVVCGNNDHCMRAYNAKDGTLLWQYQTNGEIKYGAIFDDTRDLVIFGSMDGGLYALNMSDGSLYHRFNARYGFYNNPVQSGAVIYAGSLDKVIYAYDLDTLETVWKYETSGRIFATPMIEAESLFIGSNDGRLYELDTISGRVNAVIQLSERIVNTVQIERNIENKRIIYIATHACELYKAREL
ncbi:PQQ-binding-like beta-propeller repeat protein [Candidatus Gracilibacteria bacterium]|nr:PQQ-binding-like beta-propeller repeat protein [Candidatus Gracilibacteria bacterium]